MVWSLNVLKGIVKRWIHLKRISSYCWHIWKDCAKNVVWNAQFKIIWKTLLGAVCGVSMLLLFILWAGHCLREYFRILLGRKFWKEPMAVALSVVLHCGQNSLYRQIESVQTFPTSSTLSWKNDSAPGSCDFQIIGCLFFSRIVWFWIFWFLLFSFESGNWDTLFQLCLEFEFEKQTNVADAIYPR